MRESFYIVTPELATVGEARRAYLQRMVVIVLASSCVGLSLYNWYGSCRIFQVTAEAQPNRKGSFSNFTETVDGIFNAFGVDSVKNKRSELPVGIWNGAEAAVFSASKFAPLDLDAHWGERCECRTYKSIELERDNREKLLYLWVLWLSTISEAFGILGVGCAMVEMLFIVFYPSIIAGSIFFMLAAFTEITWLSMYVIDLSYCFSESRCFFDLDFFLYLGVIGGYCFSSCGLIFGLRTYPWFLRKNRDPSNCKVVEAEICSEEELEEQCKKWETILRGSVYIAPAVSDDQGESVPYELYSQMKQKLRETHQALLRSEEECAEAIHKWKANIRGNVDDDPESVSSAGEETVPYENYAQVKDKLHATHLKLIQSEQKYRDAIARAEKAEALLRAYSENGNGHQNKAQNATIETFESRGDMET